MAIFPSCHKIPRLFDGRESTRQFMSKSHFQHNYSLIKKWLADQGIEFMEYASGTHLKILGATRAIELWPSRMKFHILEQEETLKKYGIDHYGYGQLSDRFEPNQLDELLNG